MTEYDFDENSSEGQTIKQIWRLAAGLKNKNLPPNAIINLETDLLGHTIYLHKVKAECDTMLMEAENARKAAHSRAFVRHKKAGATDKMADAQARLDIEAEQVEEVRALYRAKLLKGIIDNIEHLSRSIAHRLNDAKQEQKAAYKGQ